MVNSLTELDDEEFEKLKEHYKQDIKDKIKKDFHIEIPLTNDGNYHIDDLNLTFEYLIKQLTNQVFRKT
jgi:hypothetical protein